MKPCIENPKTFNEGTPAMSETFQLNNDTPKSYKKAAMPIPPKAAQAILFDGLDCLPGQLDLFDDSRSDRWETAFSASRNERR